MDDMLDLCLPLTMRAKVGMLLYKMVSPTVQLAALKLL